MPRRDDIGNAVSYNARFAAARPGQNQQRAFGAGDGFTLLRVETLKKVHVEGDSSNFTMRRGARTLRAASRLVPIHGDAG